LGGTLANVDLTSQVTGTLPVATDGVTGVTSSTGTGSVVLSNSPTFTGTVTIPTADINGGTIDGTVIGGSTAAAGTFTTGQFNTSLNVDGTATMDGLTVDATSTLGQTLHNTSGVSIYTRYQNNSGNDNYIGYTNNNFDVFPNNSKALTVASGGDISFYEDTGTTPKFVWDASGEILGIGGSPNAALPATGTLLQLQRTGSSRLNITAANVSYSAIDFGDTDDLDVGKIEYYHANNTMYFSTNATNRMVIDSSGNVGIGTTSFTNKLNVTGAMPSAGTPLVQLSENSGGARDGLYLNYTGTTNAAVHSLKITDASKTHLAVRGDGNVGIGTASPNSTASAGPTLEISGTAGGNLVLSDSNATSGQRAKYILSQGGELYVGHSADDGTSPVNDLVIDSSGNVGIGTASPSISSGYTSLTLNNATNSGYLVLQNNGTTKMDMYVSGGSVPTLRSISSALSLQAGGANVITFTTNASERMRIDASGNVGIGTSTPTVKLQVSGGDIGFTNSQNRTISILTGGVNQFGGTLTVSAGSAGTGGGGSDAGQLLLNGGNGFDGIGTLIRGDVIISAGANAYTNAYHGTIQFQTASGTGTKTERLRIDSSGTLLVGKTGAGTNTAGSQIDPTGRANFTVAANFGLLVNRLTSDGELARFQKDGTTVGSIGTNSNIYLVGTSSGLRIRANDIIPVDATGAGNDNALDLGIASQRWKDLYLSGGVYLGGTGAANLLDDYEEGTWTPVIRDTSEAGTIVTVTANSCTYTKIGRIVTLVGSFTRSDAASLTGNLVITGLPFTATGGQQMGGNAWVDNTSGDILCQITAANTSTMLLRRVDAPDSFVTTDDWNNLRPIYFTRTYQTS
jgi:trimeric autotransporter adhesin